MKKVLLILPFILLSLTSCKKEVNYKLPITNETSVEEFLENTCGLQKYIGIIDTFIGSINYGIQYVNINRTKNIYLFQYNNYNIVMESLNYYKCYKIVNDIQEDMFYGAIPGKENFYTLVEKFGLPDIVYVNSFIELTYYIDNDIYARFLLENNIHDNPHVYLINVIRE